jgi:hypothetical protein
MPDDDWLREKLVNLFHEARAKMRELKLPDIVSISAFDFDPFIERQLDEGEICYAVWAADKAQPRGIGYLILKGRAVVEDRSRLRFPKRTVVPCDSACRRHGDLQAP